MEVIVLRYMNVIPVSWKGGNRLKAVRGWIMNILRVMTVLWLVTHFTLVMLYVFPTNPVKDRLEPLLDATIGTYFWQNWDLFAPEPDNTDVVLLVRPLSSNEYRIAQANGLPSNGWYDLSSPL